MIDQKAQATSYDVMAAAFIFLTIVAAVTIIWNSNLTGLEENIASEEMKNTAYFTIGKLVETPGISSNWENGYDLNSLGLSKGKRIISAEKLAKLSTLDYDDVKSVMNIQGHEYWMRLIVDSNTVFSYGAQVEDANSAVGLSRIVEYNGKLGNFYFTLYE